MRSLVLVLVAAVVVALLLLCGARGAGAPPGRSPRGGADGPRLAFNTVSPPRRPRVASPPGFDARHRGGCV